MQYDLYEQPTSPPNPGKTVFLLGLSKDGPINTPIPIQNPREAESIFGSKRYGDLVKAYEQAYRIPGVTIYLMRITGEYARGEMLGDIGDTNEAVLQIRSINGGDVYNGIRVYIETIRRDNQDVEALIFEIPKADMISRAYVLSDYDTMADL